MKIIGLMLSLHSSALGIIAWSPERERLASQITLLLPGGPLMHHDVHQMWYVKSELSDCIRQLRVRGCINPVHPKEVQDLPVGVYAPSTQMIHLGLSDVPLAHRARLLIPGSLHFLSQAFPNVQKSAWVERYHVYEREVSDAPEVSLHDGVHLLDW